MSVADTIVVGVDGSPGSEHAVRWAAEEARLRKARLRAVLAWESPVQVIGGSGWIMPDAAMIEEYSAEMQQRLDEALAPLADELTGIDVERVTVHGPPAAVLIESAQEAIQLVVGTRGHGGFVGLLLGSVSQQCSSHAPCPVVIVPR